MHPKTVSVITAVILIPRVALEVYSVLNGDRTAQDSIMSLDVLAAGVLGYWLGNPKSAA